ncbi:glycosyltransferase [Nocardioides sp. SOB77]|uniref:Glycosyltransferase n=1 Tax=Nocardioides oceani TaxID=3058369 RepID=A0ABT8FLB8_9ACTN|nr:glycosyltransferase [Nocardioides oceani]MDN4175471.1 glycosyltransferase [Nocardioides oceani]
MSDRVTTVVMTRDRWPDLQVSLPHHEPPVVLVDNASADGTPQLVGRHHPDVEVLALTRNLAAPARNLGVEAARTPYVAFADDDSWWSPGALDRAADLLDAHPRLAVVHPRILVGPEERLDGLCAELARSPLPRLADLPGPPIAGFVACGVVVRRNAFLETGGFDAVVAFPGEEERVALDLLAGGWHLTYVEDVVAHHHPSPSRDPGGRRRARIARNHLLTALMRRPWPVVLREVGSVLGGRDLPAARGLLQAVRRSPRALAARRVVPGHVEDLLALLA